MIEPRDNSVFSPAAGREFSPEPGRQVATLRDAGLGVLPEEISGKACCTRVVGDWPLESERPGVTHSPRINDLCEGLHRLALAQQLAALMESGLSQTAAAQRLDLCGAKASRLLAVWRQGGRTAADFAPGHSTGRPPTVLRLTGAERRAARALVARTNRTATTGSRPEGLRQAVKAGVVRPEIADLMREREAAGLPPLSDADMAALRVSEPHTVAGRAPRNAWLDYVSSPGSLHLDINPETREQRLVPPGRRITIDDASINFICVVPGLERPGDKCWDKWRVCVGRFQLLLTLDSRTYCALGRTLTCRPRDSYRAEDILAALQIVFAEHGLPQQIVLEKGISAANSISRALGLLGIEIIRANSPHQKAVEFVFSSLWTKLSLTQGQIGRFRGEEEEGNKLLTRVRSGALDPRGVFLPLPQVLAAIDAAIAEWNAHTVHSDRYGSWSPRELYASEAARHTRPLAPQDAWMLAPHVTQPLLVEGYQIETSVSLAPGWSTKFVFAAPWLGDLDGARVSLHFNPHAANVRATAVLAADCGERKAGSILGDLDQIDAVARMTRRALGYGDRDIGLDATRAAAAALRRDSRAIRTDGREGARIHEIRDGRGASVSVTTDSAEGADKVADEVTRRSTRAQSPFRPSTEEEFSATSDRQRRLAEVRRRNAELAAV